MRWEQDLAPAVAPVAIEEPAVPHSVVGKRGAVVRAGVELDSACVGECKHRSEVLVLERDLEGAETADGRRRIRIHAPLQGWVSTKMVERVGA